MLCKNTIQKVSNMVLFKDCKLSSAATKTCKYATKHKYMYKKNKRKKKNLGIIEVQAVAKITAN